MEPQACAYVQTRHDTLNVCRDLICKEESMKGLTEYVKTGAWSMRKKKEGAPTSHEHSGFLLRNNL